MFKKTLLALAVASSVGLTGCLDDGSSGKNANPDYKISNPDFDGKTWPIFNPLASKLPIPNDLIFDRTQADGTFGVADSSPPVTTALNELSGASTVAPAVIQFNGLIDPATVIAGKTVFLIQLEYASGDPVQGLGIQEPPTVSGLANVRADVETLDGQSAIRILPLEPLTPRKRYIAVVTNDIKDINGDNVVASPSYQSLTVDGGPTGNVKLDPVQALINGLWEPSIQGALGLTDDKIALSYSFTTSGDKKVLQYIAEPASWFSDQIAGFVKLSATKQAMQAELKTYTDIKPVVDNALNTFPASLPPNPSSPLNALFGAGGPCEIPAQVLPGQDAVDCVGVALATQFRADLPTPLPGINRNVPDGSGGYTNGFNVDATSVQPAGLLSAVAGSVDATGAVLAAQGSISLPYYLGTTPGEIAGGGALSWVADDALATKLNTVFSSLGVSLPQADPSRTTAVNYIFPFPKLRSTQDVPFLALYPKNGATPIKGVVMYQHGITTDRSAALSFGTALAAQGYAVIAIDQPLHGIAPFAASAQSPLAIQLLMAGGATQAEAEALAPLVVGGDTANLAAALAGGTATQASTLKATSLINTVANPGSTIPGMAPRANERHFNTYANASNQPAAMVFDPTNPKGVGGSGSLYINLQNFLNARDNNRQSVVDQMNVRTTLFGVPPSVPGLTLPTPIAAGGDDTDVVVTAATPVYFAGHSLGTITGLPFVASTNRNQIDDTIFTAADGSTSIPSNFNDIKATSLLTPGGGIVRLLENSPAFAPKILLGLQQSGLSQGDANLETYFNVLQAALDTADPINFVDGYADTEITSLDPATVLLSEVKGDSVIPNAADEATWGVPPLKATIPGSATGLPVSVTVDSFNAPLAGTEPLTLGMFTLTPYTDGTHGTPVSTSPLATFTGMVTGTLTLFGTNP
ncbi:hypothetical protein ACTXGQ_09405 [Marinobacter sp. 1Y8]